MIHISHTFNDLLGGQLVESIDGCFFNVMGLPIGQLSKELCLLWESNRI